MNVSRNFVLSGTIFLVIGISFGIYMGASGDHSLAPLHAHINLLGFVVPMVFALAYRSFAAMGENRLSRIHFWLHVPAAVVLLVLLFLLLSGRITEDGMFPLAPLAEISILAGVILFLVNAFQNAR